jgi:hypothetical protein
MKIEVEGDMNHLCIENDLKNKRFPFRLSVTNQKNKIVDIVEYEEINRKMIEEGKISRESHLQQGICNIKCDRGVVVITEKPFLYPSKKILIENPELTGPMTGNLSNCYDCFNELFLYQIRGSDVSSPFGFQAAAAGMGYYREHPRETARKELLEEAGIMYPRILFGGKSIDMLPFMKGGKIPQPLFSFGFECDLRKFPNMKNLDDIDEFEQKIKKSGEGREAYHFTIQRDVVEKIIGELNDKKRFYGPIYQSSINFIRALRNYGYINPTLCMFHSPINYKI